jgi:hypothetical protein
MISGYSIIHFCLKANSLKLSLKHYLDYLETLSFNRKEGRARPRLSERFLVYRLGERWSEIDQGSPSAWKNKKKRRQSKFYQVVKGLCGLLE